MATTSLKLPEDVKDRVAQAAMRQGSTPHAFMVEAIRKAVSAAERRAAFVAEAVSARAEAFATGEAYEASEVHAYLRAGLSDDKVAPHPEAKPWRG
jgi:predicted transcriptional regulator